MSTIKVLQPTDLITDSRADINDNFSNLNTDKLEASDIAGKIDKTVLHTANSVMIATTSDTPTELAVATNNLVGRINGSIVNVPIDSDLTSTSAGDDTVPSAKATKAMGDLKLAKTDQVTSLAATAAGDKDKYLHSNSSTGALEWSTVATGGSSLWTLMPGTPTRTGNTTFTVTDTSNTNKYNLLLSRLTCLKWTESGTLKQAMIVSATYATDTVTVTIIGDTMASVDSGSLKYFSQKALFYKFAIAGTIGATATNLANTIMCEVAGKIYGADIWAGTAGNGTTTVDINKNGTTMFTTKPSITTTNQSGLGFTADTGTVTAVGDYLTIDQDAVAATTAITDEYVNLYYLPLYNTYLS